MIFSEQDIELLKLLRWCRCIEPDDLQSLFSDTEILNLMGAGLIKLHVSGLFLLLTSEGNRFLDNVCSQLPKVLPSYREKDILRHIRTAKIMLTAYRSALSVFNMTLDETALSQGVFLPSLSRGRGRNIWGNSRISAIGNIGGAAYAFHFVFRGIGKISLADELRAFTSNAAAIPGERRLIFCGESYRSVLEELDTESVDTGSRLSGYWEAYRRSPLSVHLLSLDKTGTAQLRIMAIPDYREKLTRAALGAQYQPAVPILDCDAMYDGQPFLMAADMDLRRIDRLCITSAEHGYPKPVLVCLEEQAGSVLYARYRDTGKARIFALTPEGLTKVLGQGLEPHGIMRTPYFTAKGEIVNAPIIKAHSGLFPHRGTR